MRYKSLPVGAGFSRGMTYDRPMPMTISPPGADEYAEFHKGYMAAMAGETDAIAVLERQQPIIEAFRRLTADQAGYRYAEGKWTVREILGHLADAERVFSYRLLRLGRADQTPLPGFDERAYAATSNADLRPLGDLVDELAAVRLSTIALARSLDDSALANRGLVNHATLSARAVAFIIPGHFQHHLDVLRDRYAITPG